MGNIRNVYQIFVGVPEGKRLLERFRCRWEDNSRLDLKEIDWEDMDWIYLAQEGYKSISNETSVFIIGVKFLN
jgi:hypothetical protein